MSYFESTVQYGKTLENGTEKRVTEHYIVTGETFSDAEYKTVEKIMPYANGDLFIKDIKRKSYSEIYIDNTAERWYECKIAIICIDEKSGAEKKSYSTFLVQASSSDNAASNLKECMKGSVVDWETHTIKETPILDVFSK